jgi:hypothetical protein
MGARYQFPSPRSPHCTTIIRLCLFSVKYKIRSNSCFFRPRGRPLLPVPWRPNAKVCRHSLPTSLFLIPRRNFKQTVGQRRRVDADHALGEVQ